MRNIFTEHPHSIGETYLQHWYYALITGFKMVFAGLLCIIHAFFPFLFITSGSDMLLRLTHDFVERMPRVEPRIKNLSQVINNKIANETEVGS